MKILSNKLHKTMALVAISLSLCGCSDFLNIEPKTIVSEDNFWNEKQDIDQMVAGAYVSMQGRGFIERCLMWGETRSDNIAEGFKTSDNVNIYRVLRENLLSTNVYTDWNSFYSLINRCNTIIERAPQVSEKDPVYTESDVRATIAEMKALRSLSYFYLVRAFKDVPYYTYAVEKDDEVQDIAPSNGDSIVSALIADLEGCVGDALKAFPDDKSQEYNTTKNRITQNAIYALLADLCLWNGDYAKTVQYAQYVIDAKVKEYQEEYSHRSSFSADNVSLFKHVNDTYSTVGYPLYPCFSGTGSTAVYGYDFNRIFGGDQNSFESIFELAFNYTKGSTAYSANPAFAYLFGNYFLEKTNDVEPNAGQGILGVNPALLSDISSNNVGKFFTRRDVRYFTNINNPALSKGQGEYSIGYPQKYVAYSLRENDNVTSPLGTLFAGSYLLDANRNFIFYRLTDVMLMQAEALCELGSVDAEGNPDDNLKHAFYLTWAVNRRSIMESSTTTEVRTYELQLKNVTSQEMMRELVLKERRLELMFEGKRWFDLLRQCHRQKNTDYIRYRVSAKSTSGSSSNLFTNYESLFWPYNKTEVKNNKLLNQKPYYGDEGDEGNFSTTR